MKSRILERIRNDGPLGFDDYMEMALYDPGAGFFASGRVRPGTEGDFVTSPEVSPWFGRLLGRWAVSVARPRSRLIEIGAGSGALIEPLLAEVDGAFSQVVATERSIAARRMLGERVPEIDVVEVVADLPRGGHAAVIMNEVLDNVPFRLVRNEQGTWHEVTIGAVGNELVFDSAPADQPLSTWCDTYLDAAVDGALMAAQMAAHALVDEILTHFGSCDLLIIDYSAMRRSAPVSDAGGVVRGYAAHRRDDEILAEPGSIDITTDLDVDALERWLPAAGYPHEVMTQRALLASLGADDIVRDLTNASHAKAREGDTMGQLALRSEATGLRALLDPNGLGGFVAIRVSSGTG